MRLDTCSACEHRRMRGSDGQCPACANERSRTTRRDPTPAQFEAAEQIAQFVLEEAHEYEHIEAVHAALVRVAERIRTADWTPLARETARGDKP